MKFSAYTQVTKCKDLNDVEAGLAELAKYIEQTAKPSKKALIRFARLNKKHEALSKQVEAKAKVWTEEEIIQAEINNTMIQNSL